MAPAVRPATNPAATGFSARLPDLLDPDASTTPARDRDHPVRQPDRAFLCPSVLLRVPRGGLRPPAPRGRHAPETGLGRGLGWAATGARQAPS